MRENDPDPSDGSSTDSSSIGSEFTEVHITDLDDLPLDYDLSDVSPDLFLEQLDYSQSSSVTLPEARAEDNISLRNACWSIVTNTYLENGFFEDVSGEDVAILTELLETRRAILLSQLDSTADFDNSSHITKTSATGGRVPKSFRDEFLAMESLLRLLASALRLYANKSKDYSLYSQLHELVNRFQLAFHRDRSYLQDHLGIEYLNVSFLLTHCRYLLMSINDSRSLSSDAVRIAIFSFSGETANENHPSEDQRSKPPSWHARYCDLDDLGLRVARQLQIGSDGIDEIGDGGLLRACMLLRKGVEETLQRIVDEEHERYMLHAARADSISQNISEGEKQYLSYGILDLLYQLTFRVKKRSSPRWFGNFISTVRLVLENAPNPEHFLHRKAVDLWNRIREAETKDHLVYGNAEDRVWILHWINQNWGKGYA